MVELRKRPAPPAAPPPAKKKATAPKKTKSAKTAEPAAAEPVVEEPVAEPVDAGAVETAAKKAVAATAKKSSKTTPPKRDESIDLEGFGGEIETNDGQQTTLAKLAASSKAGVVLFTYPKASTPGCKLALYCRLVAAVD